MISALASREHANTWGFVFVELDPTNPDLCARANVQVSCIFGKCFHICDAVTW